MIVHHVGLHSPREMLADKNFEAAAETEEWWFPICHERCRTMADHFGPLSEKRPFSATRMPNFQVADQPYANAQRGQIRTGELVRKL